MGVEVKEDLRARVKYKESRKGTTVELNPTYTLPSNEGMVMPKWGNNYYMVTQMLLYAYEEIGQGNP